MARNKENDRHWKREYYKKNRTAFREKGKARYQREKDKVRDYNFKRNFGISLVQYGEMFEKQNGLCAICHKPEHLARNGNTLKLAVDHCHKTGKVRQLLCACCNSSLGKLQEDTKIMKSMIAYVEAHNVE